MPLPLALLGGTAARAGLPALLRKMLPGLMRGASGAGRAVAKRPSRLEDYFKPILQKGVPRGKRFVPPSNFATATRPGMGRRAMNWIGQNPWKSTGLGALPFFMMGGRSEEEELGMPLDVSPSLDMPPSPVSDMHPEDIMELLLDSEGEPVTWGDDYTIGTGGAFDDVGRYIKPSDRVDSGEVDLLELFGIR